MNTERSLKELVEDALNSSMSYEDYRSLLALQAKDGQTSGKEQSDSLIHYTRLNHQRMKRWHKKAVLPESVISALQALKEDTIWLVLTETWCGDAAPVLPFLNAYAEESHYLDLRIAFRDENLCLMDEFLTDDARAIPKLIVVRKRDLTVLNSWGPRPEKAMKLVRNFKARYHTLTPEFRTTLQTWYNTDQGGQLIDELSALLGLE